MNFGYQFSSKYTPFLWTNYTKIHIYKYLIRKVKMTSHAWEVYYNGDNINTEYYGELLGSRLFLVLILIITEMFLWQILHCDDDIII